MENIEQAAAIARACGMELTAEEVEKLFQEIQLRKDALAEPRKLDMDEMEAVSGGSKGLPICKGTITCSMVGFDSKGNIISFSTQSWCWSGADYCMYWTETYDGIKVY